MAARVLVLSTLLLVIPLPVAAAEGSGERSPDAFAHDFVPAERVGVPTSRNRVTAVEDGYEGPGSRVVIERGSYFGADLEFDFSREVGDEPEELWFRYFVRLDDDFSLTTGGKLPGFGGVYTATGKGGRPGTAQIPGWSARVRMYPSDPDGAVRLGWYVYHVDQQGIFGDSMRWSGMGARLRPGRWHCVEGHVALNTPGANDGVLEAWVDAISVHTRSDLRFRRAGEEAIGIESFWFDVYHGGKQRAPTSLGMTFDHVRIASTRVGCGWDAAIETTTADVTGDGVEDLISWIQCPGGCFVVEPGGTEGVDERIVIDASTPVAPDGFGLGVVGADVDGDGTADLVYPGVCDHDCWRVQRGLGGLTEVWGDADLGGVVDVAAGDIDGDGRDDLILVRSCDRQWCVDWRRAGEGGFESAVRIIDRLGSIPIRLVPGEFTGDGAADLLISGSCESGVCFLVFPSTPSGLGPAEVWGVDDVAPEHRLSAVDVTGDGLDDLVFVESCRSGACAQAYMNDAPGFVDSVDLTAVPDRDARLMLGRFEPDREVDLIYRWGCSDEPCTRSLAISTTSSDLIPGLVEGLVEASLAAIRPEVISRIV